MARYKFTDTAEQHIKDGVTLRSFPASLDNRDYKAYLKYVADGGEVADPYVRPVEDKIVRCKMDTEEVILAQMPEWKQRNMLAQAILQVESGKNRSTSTTLMQSLYAYDWVDRIRALSGQIEANIIAGTGEQDIKVAAKDIPWPLT